MAEGEGTTLDTGTALGGAGADDAAGKADVADTAVGKANEQSQQKTALGEASDDQAKEGASEGSEGDAGKEGEGDKGKSEGESAPETYEDFTMPEGMELDKEAVERYSPIFKELNLTQEQAQQLVSMRADEVQAFQDAQINQWNAVRTEWLETAKADPDIGGAKYDETMVPAGAAVREFATPEFVQMMDELGVGNHPEMIRFVARVGKELSEGTVRTSSGQNPQSETTIARRLYPSMDK